MTNAASSIFLIKSFLNRKQCTVYTYVQEEFVGDYLGKIFGLTYK